MVCSRVCKMAVSALHPAVYSLAINYNNFSIQILYTLTYWSQSSTVQHSESIIRAPYSSGISSAFPGRFIPYVYRKESNNACRPAFHNKPTASVVFI